MPALLGTLLDGRYRLDAEIATGGSATVYRALDTTLERPVAVKVLHTDIAGDGDQLERFRREARAVAQLSHPGIVGVIDAGEDQGHPYIVLEYIQGETLKQHIRRLGPLAPTNALAYAIELTRALDAAHTVGIVHRDVKPQNVLLDEEGGAKVADFGIARAGDDAGLTGAGRVVGTTDYVSPEQALGEEVGPQSDIYSLGVVLYEMLVGAVPFTGESQVVIAMKHVRDALPDVQRRRPEISATLAAIVERATAKSLDRRYGSAGELLADLEEALALETARAGGATGEATAVLRSLPASSRRRVPARPAAATVAAAAVALAAVVAMVTIALLARAERGPGGGRAAEPASGLERVRLAARAAHDYDPLGTAGEHGEETALALDGNPNTKWTTETYKGGLLDKAGVGLYVDARPGTIARRLDLLTPTPGFRATIFAATEGPPASVEDPGWTKVGGGLARSSRHAFPLAGERKFTYFLVWITRLAPGRERAEIAELALLR